MRWKRKIAGLFACLLIAGQAAALDYTIEAPENYLFGRASSVEIIHRETEPVNQDRSKNVAMIPPGFGTPTSYLPGSGEYLTPNLVPGALSGGLVNSVAGASYTAGYTAYDNAPYPSVNGVSYSYGSTGTDNFQYPSADTFAWSYEPNDSGRSYGTGFTDVADNLYYNDGHLGTLKIPAIGVNVKIYEGTDSKQLAKGAGHFTDTSIWDGNPCFAAHNRGTNAYFGQIHTLDIGDKITLTTKLGTRNYSVTSVKKISETDNSDTAGTWDNCVTLFTCVRDEREFRWCVRAVETLS